MRVYNFSVRPAVLPYVDYVNIWFGGTKSDYFIAYLSVISRASFLN